MYPKARFFSLKGKLYGITRSDYGKRYFKDQQRYMLKTVNFKYNTKYIGFPSIMGYVFLK